MPVAVLHPRVRPAISSLWNGSAMKPRLARILGENGSQLTIAAGSRGGQTVSVVLYYYRGSSSCKGQIDMTTKTSKELGHHRCCNSVLQRVPGRTRNVC